MDDRRLATLAALCDTFVPPVRPPSVEAGDPTGFWARRASDLDVAPRVASYLEQIASPADLEGLAKLLDVLRLAGIERLPQRLREGLLHALARLDADAAEGLDAYRGLTMLEYYGSAVDGHNPNWEQFRYPGPPRVEPSPDRAFAPLRPGAGDDRLELTADVVVVGSGAGGGLIAGVLAQSGMDVVVVEAGPPAEEIDFPRDEASALRRLYWRGGLGSTEDGNVAVLAGATLGGGSTINWMNCVRPPDHVREQWARDHGLHGLDGGDFDAHLEAVLSRIGATAERTELNGPNQRLREGAEAHGWSWTSALRNSGAADYDPATAGHVGFGDRTGNKQGTLRTYLRDAVDAGARIVTDCTIERILTRGGRAAGVAGTFTGAHDGASAEGIPVEVRAPQVVVAAGALETPALLLRSGVGGAAVGRHLRLHPVPNIAGFYREPQEAWWGPPQACIVDEFAATFDGYGYLVETPHMHVGLSAAAIPWTSGRDHKLIMGRAANLSSFLAVVRERGSGSVTVDETGAARVHYPLDDPFDHDVIRHAVRTMIAAHVAAGADAIVDLTPGRPLWRRGEDHHAYADRVAEAPLGADGRGLFSAHQMGTARMGNDPATSVADPDGQLHDTPGIWVGDTSAFPTAVGSNPMVTCMALAHRTATALLAATD